jgi:radical SAM superfamily enzyme YgiQ (UPF0313 family)
LSEDKLKLALIQCPAWTVESPPYALALLSAVLARNSHEVKCFDLNASLFHFCKNKAQPSSLDAECWTMGFRGNVWYDENVVLDFIKENEAHIDRLIDGVLGSGAIVVGFSVQSTSKHFSLEIARKIKQRDPKKVIIFGGPLCFLNCYGVDILKDFPFLDAVCLSEAEEAFVAYLDDLENVRGDNLCPGIAFRSKDGSIIDGGPAPLIESLDALPFADYSIFDLSLYEKSLLPIATSRGCFNKCTFCSESPHWRRYRPRSAQNIYSEIIHQQQRYPHIDRFWFNDSLINGDMRALGELCDLLIANGVKIKWGGQGMIRREMTLEFLSRMRQAGCEVISYGVESGSDGVLKMMRKGYPAELAAQVIRKTAEAGIQVIFNIIIGFPTETDKEFQETLSFVSRLKSLAVHIELPMYLLLKGSYIYEHPAEFNVDPHSYRLSDPQGRWISGDGLNTYEVRQARLDRMRALLAA